MRLLCLLFPRLGVQLIRRRQPELCGRAVVTLAGEGDEALVSTASAEASAAGVVIGMLASAGRERILGASFLDDNANECLDLLEQASSILRLRATPTVAIAGREHLFVDLRGLESLFPDEMTAATRLAELVRSWTGCDVRAGVASTREAALDAAHQARRFPVVNGSGLTDDGIVVSPSVVTEVHASYTWSAPAEPVAVRARLVRMLGSLQTVLEGRHESFREVSLELRHASGAAGTVTLHPAMPLHRAGEVLQLLGGKVPDDVLTGIVGLELTLGRLGPDIRIEPVRRETRSAPVIESPIRPIQRRLLRAS
ncbi:MAG: hypothetical protein ABI305_03395 [Tepidiformaceae bacterium]